MQAIARNMSESESELSTSSQRTVDSPDGSFSADSENEDMFVVAGQYEPYQNEPLAPPDRQNVAPLRQGEDLDKDGLSPQTLAQRYQRQIDLESWCKCGKCSLELLVGALEHRCCMEVAELGGKLTFDGSIERIKCITDHEDYQAVTNKDVLLLAGPLLKRKDGGRYRKNGISENQ